MTFTNTLWNDISPIYSKIIEHPFNQELCNGTLSKEQFQFYIKQDALYLIDFAKALSVVASRATDADLIIDFIKFAEGAIVAERGLHHFYLELFGTTLDVDYAPSCFSYINFMLATASIRTFEEGVAALLPCFWIYWKVGNYIFKESTALSTYPSNPYRKWIDTYSSQEFGMVVEKMIGIVEKIANEASPLYRVKMKKAFEYSTKLEWQFWESAYKLEKWCPL